MPGFPRPPRRLSWTPLFVVLSVGFFGCAANGPGARAPAPLTSKALRASAASELPPRRGKAEAVSLPPAPQTLRVSTPSANLRPAGPPASASSAPFPVMLGIDVLEAEGFVALRGKRVGLLTNPAGVNRRGESTIDVLRRAPGVNLVALFGPEHGIYGNEKAEVPIDDNIDPRTGLPVYSLYGKTRKPTPRMLAGLDALIVDLQDIGTRSYTFTSSMLYVMAACFEAGIECIVLDRPNPLGGLKVDGPPLDAEWKSFVGAFRVPYVHGLTLGELARLAHASPGGLTVPAAINTPDEARLRGKLTVIPMRGWRRDMRWPETGLQWVPTSPYIQDFAAVVGYPMTGLGTYMGGFSHGFPGPLHPFRGISYRGKNIDFLERELTALRLPGLAYRRITINDRRGRPVPGLYIQVTDWNAWRPTELNFHLMQLTARWESTNPFAKASGSTMNGFVKHVGSGAFVEALRTEGARTDVSAWFDRWDEGVRIYQQQVRRFWLYR